MDNIATNIESLYEKAKDYAEIKAKIFRLKAIDKTADVASSLLTRLIIVLSAAMFLLFVNVALSLYLGKLLGENYLGFLIISAIYLILTLVFSASKNKMFKIPLTNLIIAKLLEEKVRSNNSNTTTDDDIL